MYFSVESVNRYVDLFVFVCDICVVISCMYVKEGGAEQTYRFFPLPISVDKVAKTHPASMISTAQ